jgi:hypothetical protein
MWPFTQRPTEKEIIRSWEHVRRRVLNAEKQARELQQRYSHASKNPSDPFAEKPEHVEIEMGYLWRDIAKDFERYAEMTPTWMDHELPTLYRWAQAQHLNRVAQQLRNESQLTAPASAGTSGH